VNDTRTAWTELSERRDALGLKLKLHFEQSRFPSATWGSATPAAGPKSRAMRARRPCGWRRPAGKLRVMTTAGTPKSATEPVFSRTVRGRVTRLTIDGEVGAEGCERLREALQDARAARRTGPIVVDFVGVSRLALPALLVLRRVADEVRRAGRPLTVRNLEPAAVGSFPSPSAPPSQHAMRA
jgi:anti-anti-sigma regulatory factor